MKFVENLYKTGEIVESLVKFEEESDKWWKMYEIWSKFA